MTLGTGTEWAVPQVLYPISSSGSDDDLQVNALMIGGGGGRGAEIHWWRVGISTTLIFFLMCKKHDNIKENVTRGIRNHRILLL